MPENLAFTIPLKVLQDTRLTLSSRFVYAEILAGSIQKGYSWASNAHFCDVLGISDRTVTYAIRELVEYKYITVNNPKGKMRQIIPITKLNRANPAKIARLKNNPAKIAPNPANSAVNPARLADVDTIETKETNKPKNWPDYEKTKEMLLRKKL